MNRLEPSAEVTFNGAVMPGQVPSSPDFSPSAYTAATPGFSDRPNQVISNGGPTVKPVAAKVNPNSTQNALQIAEIRDGVVIMSDGSFRSVVMAKSINFDLMSQVEQEAVEYSYQGFLNSLYFPSRFLSDPDELICNHILKNLKKFEPSMTTCCWLC